MIDLSAVALYPQPKVGGFTARGDKNRLIAKTPT